MPSPHQHLYPRHGRQYLAALVTLLIGALALGCGNSAVTIVPPTAIPTDTDRPLPTPTATLGPVTIPWSVSTAGDLLQIAYERSDGTAPQYGVLDRASSYLRLNPGPPSGWGTSIILLPAFWSKTACSTTSGYCQSARVNAQANSLGASLVLTVTGTIGGLNVTTVVQIDPPSASPAEIHAHVDAKTTGQVALDISRPWESFKPVMLSSMHVSSTLWDSHQATTDGVAHTLPAKGWIVSPPVSATSFGLVGGRSTWKAHAPTVTIALAKPLLVTGYVKVDTHPNDENVGYWATDPSAPSAWSYDITVSPAS